MTGNDLDARQDVAADTGGQPGSDDVFRGNVLYSRFTLLLASLLGLSCLAFAAFFLGGVRNGEGLVVAILALIAFLVIGGFIRFRCRMGLRSFLIAVTVLSVVLALTAQILVRVRTTQVGVDQLKEDGVSITWSVKETNDWQQTESGFPMPPWLVGTFGPAAFSDVVHADFSATRVTRKRIALLKTHCPKIRQLSLYRADIEAGALEGLGRLDSLEYLDLTGSNVRNQDLVDAVEGSTSLKSIFLRNTTVDHQGVAAFASLPKLEIVWLDGSTVSDEEIAALGVQTNMVSLYACNGKKVTSASLNRLPETMPNLRNLNVGGNWTIDSDCGPAIAKLRNLSMLNVQSTSVDDRFLESLGATSLKYLYVMSTNVTLEGIAAFQEKNPGCKLEHNLRVPPAP